MVDGLQVKTADLFEAPAILQRVDPALVGNYRLRDWSQTQGSLFRAVKLEKLVNGDASGQGPARQMRERDEFGTLA